MKIKEKVLLVGLIVLGLTFSFSVLSSGTLWFSPTSATSEDGECIGGNCWGYSSNAQFPPGQPISVVFDENVNTAVCDTYFAGWGKYLYLHRIGSADRIRFNAYYNATNTNLINIDIFYQGGWHNIVNNATYTNHEWVEVEIPGGVKAVEQARILIRTSVRYTRAVYEFDFGLSYSQMPIGDILGAGLGFAGEIFTDLAPILVVILALRYALLTILPKLIKLLTL